MIRAILFDLDETLILDHPVSIHAMRSCAFYAASWYSLDLDALILSFTQHAKALWSHSPTHEYTERIGHSYGEGLWARYETQVHPAIARLQEWAPHYRVAAWKAALAEQNLEDEALAEALVERFISERRLYPRYPEVDKLLGLLSGYKIGIVTNGVPDLQSDKLEGCGLMAYVDAAVISGQIDIGKPELGIFSHICSELQVEPRECVMVGDNPERDVAGAIKAGMKSVWVERGFKSRDSRFTADLAVKDLLEMLPWLANHN